MIKVELEDRLKQLKDNNKLVEAQRLEQRREEVRDALLEVGYVLAVLALGTLARSGWDRSMPKMAIAMLVGNVLIYVPGLIWLGLLYGWDKPILQWGLTPFLIGDAAKLALAVLIFPKAWKIINTTIR